MYGYEPPREPRGSWREILTFTWVGFTVVFPFMFALIGVLLLVVLALVLASRHVALVLIPLAVIGLVVWFFVWRDRRAQAQYEADMERRHRRRT